MSENANRAREERREEVDALRRRLLRYGAYAAPAIIATLVLPREAWGQAGTCVPPCIPKRPCPPRRFPPLRRSPE